jgi:NAD(P)-dependent dehydrogenase (short-subunit alcohol dehydrogenase family)
VHGRERRPAGDTGTVCSLEAPLYAAGGQHDLERLERLRLPRAAQPLGVRRENAGLEALMRHLAVELAPDGIPVNAFAPSTGVEAELRGRSRLVAR